MGTDLSGLVSCHSVVATVQVLKYDAPASSTWCIYLQHLVQRRVFGLDEPQGSKRAARGLLLTEFGTHERYALVLREVCTRIAIKISIT